MVSKLIVSFRSKAEAKKFRDRVLKEESENGVSGGNVYLCKGRHHVQIWGKIEDDTYQRILGGRKDVNLK